MTLEKTKSPVQIAAAEVLRLARLDTLDYELCRRQGAAELRLRVGVLDALVARAREQYRRARRRHDFPEIGARGGPLPPVPPADTSRPRRRRL